MVWDLPGIFAIIEAGVPGRFYKVRKKEDTIHAAFCNHRNRENQSHLSLIHISWAISLETSSSITCVSSSEGPGLVTPPEEGSAWAEDTACLLYTSKYSPPSC